MIKLVAEVVQSDEQPYEMVDTMAAALARNGEFKEAELEVREYDGGRGVMDLEDTVVFQDWGLTEGQQAGWRSRGYQEPYLAAQETRVRRFHEILHDYLDGKPPGR